MAPGGGGRILEVVPMSVLERRPSRLDVFMVATAATAVPVVVQATRTATQIPHGVQLALVGILALGVVLGELFPIEIARLGRRSDEITVSTTLALALALVAPLGWALVAQSLPLVVDDLRRRKHWSRPMFNVAQYALTFAAAKAVFVALSRTPNGGAALSAHDLPAVFAAAAVYFLVNQVLVGTAVALWTGESPLSQLRDDGLFHLGTSGLLVCLAPVVLAVTQFSLILAPVLMLPLVAVRNSARMAVQRQHDALHDTLTGLPNRAFLRNELERRLYEGQGAGGSGRRGLAVLLLDIDHFKEINDTLGHLAGDQLIREVATRLLEATRPADGSSPAGAGPATMVARLGGDEFAVLADLEGPAERWTAVVAALAETITAQLGQTVILAEVRLAVSASIGVAVAPWHGTTVDDLVAKADVAMYAAKKQHQGWAFYDAAQDSHSPERLALLTELREGIDQGQLLLAYQPKCDARTRRLNSVEALVRWQHPVRGLLAPDQFVGVAESTGIITSLTFAVLEEAVRQAGVWRDAGRPIPVAVNLSARLLTDLHLPIAVDKILRAHDLPGDLLTLEVTESTIMNDPTRATTICAGLRALGVRLAIDDYGTGYSSLSYLCRLQADELKIDKSFVQKLGSGSPSGADHGEGVIVRSTIDLGRSLGMSVVAEGVEDEEVWQLLAGLGCDLVQGYVLTPPLLAPAFDAWLERWEGPVKAPGVGSLPAPRGGEVIPAC
jgi:diguanylate cyclase (GGDEF)-like protein